jgi:hypothetical protein
MSRRENEFPTISDARDRLAELVERGFGDLPIQLVIVPGSTLQAIAGPRDKPALMIDLLGDPGRMPVGLISTECLSTPNYGAGKVN